LPGSFGTVSKNNHIKDALKGHPINNPGLSTKGSATRGKRSGMKTAQPVIFQKFKRSMRRKKPSLKKLNGKIISGSISIGTPFVC